MVENQGERDFKMPWGCVPEILIIGPGKMGSGLALAFAQQGFSVLLVGRSQASLSKSLSLIEGSLEEGIEKGIFKAEEAKKIKEKIFLKENNLDAQEIEAVKLAIEAIDEDFQAKVQVLVELEPLLPASTILATTTSSLDAEKLGAFLNRREKFIWLHFFFPGQKIKAVEVAGLSATSSSTMSSVLDLLRQAKREVVLLNKYRRGGVANIILASLILEALRLIEEGYEARLVEEASCLAFNLPMGLISLLTWLGPETALAVANSFSQTSDPMDPIFQAYDNFFTLPAQLLELIKTKGNQGLDAYLKAKNSSMTKDPSLQPLILELARQRFQAVAFMTASEVVQAGLIEPSACDRLCQLAFGWPTGPFALMNRLGIETSLRLVTERMELSHRREINFPVPRNLIEKAQKRELWPVS